MVTSERVKEINKLIERQTELLRDGIAIVAGDYNYQTQYEYTDLNSIKPAMIAEARSRQQARVSSRSPTATNTLPTSSM